jgi:RNA dependent RNA polymerase
MDSHSPRARAVQHKCRLPVRDAVNLLGVLDESGTLAASEVYLSWTPQLADGSVGLRTTLPTGTRVAVSRCPCLSASDIRILTVADERSLAQTSAASRRRCVRWRTW